MSTNSSEVGMVFCGFTSVESLSNRSSGTGTTPTFGSMVQNGSWSPSRRQTTGR
jgi:hypothetical protein